MKYSTLLLSALFSLSTLVAYSADTLTSLQEGDLAPQNFEELWADFDPRAEPLDIEILKEWEEDDVVFKVIRYRVGVFKGVKSMVAAVYGYPKGGSKLPALINLHGGGQYADSNAIAANAKRGYATISVSWAGRISAPDYKVNPDTVKLFWANKTEHKNYKVTTDWGAVDGYHAPCRNPKNASRNVKPQDLTLDNIESPRNSLWFLGTLAARRAITFLEQQPQINPEKIGIYGHSMGGKLTVLTAASDKRIKAAVPSCGGISNNENPSDLYNASIGDNINLSNITCPILFLSPANDFHANYYDLTQATKLIKSPDYRIVSSAHHNHQDTGQYMITGLLWLDQYLKSNTQKLPKTPETKINFGSNKINISVTPDTSWKIDSVDIYYTQQGLSKDKNNPRFKFWHSANATQNATSWSSELALANTENPVCAFANITYKLDTPDSGANYYYADYTTSTATVSSKPIIIETDTLKKHKIAASLKPSLLIEDFKGNWKKDWFSYKPSAWAIATNKLYNPIWDAPNKTSDTTKLVIDVLSEKPNKLVILLGRGKGSGTEIELTGGNQWQTISLSPVNFKNASGISLKNWDDLNQLELTHHVNISAKFNNDGIVKTDKLKLGNNTWQGADPQFRNLRWEPANK